MALFATLAHLAVSRFVRLIAKPFWKIAVHEAIDSADLIISIGHDTVEKPPFLMGRVAGGPRVILRALRDAGRFLDAGEAVCEDYHSGSQSFHQGTSRL